MDFLAEQSSYKLIQKFCLSFFLFFHSLQFRVLPGLAGDFPADPLYISPVRIFITAADFPFTL